MPNSNNGQSRKKPQTKQTNQKTNKSKKVTTGTTQQNKKSKKKQRKHPKLRMFIKITLILFLLLCIIGAGIVAAIFYGLFQP